MKSIEKQRQIKYIPFSNSINKASHADQGRYEHHVNKSSHPSEIEGNGFAKIIPNQK